MNQERTTKYRSKRREFLDRTLPCPLDPPLNTHSYLIASRPKLDRLLRFYGGFRCNAWSFILLVRNKLQNRLIYLMLV